MADIIKLQPKRAKEPGWWGHKCANFRFKLRDDGVIICDKCGESVGDWLLYRDQE